MSKADGNKQTGVVSAPAQRIRPIRAMVKRMVRPYPVLFIPIFRAFGGATAKKLLISRQTQVVMEGYPRSANTFSVVAFQTAGNRGVRIAHHLHAEAQIIAGVRRGLPVMVLVREPEAAVRSLKMIFPTIDENDAMRDWIRFYRRILPYRDKVFFAEFSRVTSGFGAVIAAFNEKFGTDFVLFDHTEENVSAAYQEIEEIDRQTSGGSDMYVARPSAVKRDAQASTQFAFDAAILAQARRLYDDIMTSIASPVKESNG